MRLRCPENDCAIQVPDELLGTQIRCPVCGVLTRIHERDRDITLDQIKEGDPSATPASEAAKKEAPDLEYRIYDGLPPLSVMIALRRRQGANYDAADFARRYEMTADDWKALDAFETVLHAVAALRISTVVCGAIFVINLFMLFATSENEMPIFATVHPFVQLLLCTMIGLGLFMRFLGQSALARIQFGAIYEFLIPVILLTTVGFCLEAWIYASPIFFQRSIDSTFLNFVGALFNLVAVFDMCRSGLLVRKAQAEVAPPEIAHRLSEALKYLA